MKMAVRFAAAVFCIVCGNVAGAGPQTIRSRVSVGPNIRVSTDSEKSHFEPMLASAGTKVLIASSNLTGGDNNGWITKAYISRDSGNTWFSVWFPELLTSENHNPSGDAIAG